MNREKAKQLAQIARQQAGISTTPGAREVLLAPAEKYEKIAKGSAGLIVAFQLILTALAGFGRELN